jgi:hypothetical protein
MPRTGQQPRAKTLLTYHGKQILDQLDGVRLGYRAAAEHQAKRGMVIAISWADGHRLKFRQVFSWLRIQSGHDHITCRWTNDCTGISTLHATIGSSAP